VRQTRDDLVRHLHDEIDLLRTSGAAFDDGSIVQAKILAVRIRVLVHDTDRSKSLLRQLRVKDGLRFIDTSQTPPPPGAVMIDAGLASIRIGFGDGASTEYAAPLGSRDRRPPLPFRPWWSETVLDDDEGNRFNRRDLVLGLAHTEGGAHVSPELDRAYAALARSNSLGFGFGSADGSEFTDAGSPVPVNVRQIAWELQTTIEEQLPQLLTT